MLDGWDATELQNFQLEDGTTYQTVVTQMNAALAALNAELQNGLWGMLCSFTDQPDLEYRQGVSNGFSPFTEYGRGDAQRADTTGHMLPLVAYDRVLGWTWSYLRDARMPQIDADIADAIKDARDIWRQKILTRLLQRGDDSGTNKGLGSSGYSPGFATTAGSTSVDFTPPALGGTTFDSTHEHYVGISGGAFTNAVFQDAKAELREHGHEPPYEFIIGPSDETTVRGLSDTYEVGSDLVKYGMTQDIANLQIQAVDTVGSYFIGVNTDFAIRVVRGIPQYYGFGWKSYGQRSQRNPIKIRLKKGVSTPQFTAMPDPVINNGRNPLQDLMLFAEFGVGVGMDRTNGTPRYVNNATWADGTVT